MGSEPTLAHATVDGHCHSCGAPLATGQRYCLNCGVRREDRPASTQLAPRPVVAFPPEPTLAARVGGGWGVAALVLLALGIGVVIGSLGDDDPAPVAAQPPVVTISAGPTGPTATPPPATVPPAATSPPATVPPAATSPIGPTGATGATGTTR